MVSEILLLLSASSLGIFTGAQITEAFLFVPYWKRLPADDFFAQHETQGKEIYRFFAPLTLVATIFPLISTAYHLANRSADLFLWLLLGASTLIFFSTYFLFFKAANQAFAQRTIPNSDLPAAISKWGNWHWGRIFFEVIAFATSLILLMRA